MQAELDVAKELDRQLNLNEAVLRTKLTRPGAHQSPRRTSPIPASTPVRRTALDRER
jgi:hypothetical protein